MNFVKIDEVPVQGKLKSEERLLVESFKDANIPAALVEGVPDNSYTRNRLAQRIRNASKDLNVKVVTRNGKLYLINLELSNDKY